MRNRENRVGTRVRQVESEIGGADDCRFAGRSSAERYRLRPDPKVAAKDDSDEGMRCLESLPAALFCDQPAARSFVLIEKLRQFFVVIASVEGELHNADEVPP